MTITDDNESNLESSIEVEQLELDPESAVEIEDAIREALEAVEKSDSEGVEAAEDSTSEEDEDPDPEDLVAELAELRERSLRTLADFENYRKRIQRERADDARYANVPIVKEFLTILDNLERAKLAEGSAEDLQKGVELILQQMQDLVRRFGVTRIDAAGLPFDPNLHEAVSRQEDADVAMPMVVEEFQAGYQMHERLLRPAVVRVAMPPEAIEA
ncbi:MAG: nucleotide exchange factor GrpE, partial [Thermoanaerobaculia bacterium]